MFVCTHNPFGNPGCLLQRTTRPHNWLWISYPEGTFGNMSWRTLASVFCFFFGRFGLRFLRLLETQCLWCSNDLLPWRSMVRLAPPLSCFRDFWMQSFEVPKFIMCSSILYIHFINFHWPRPWMTSLPETFDQGDQNGYHCQTRYITKDHGGQNDFQVIWEETSAWILVWFVLKHIGWLCMICVYGCFKKNSGTPKCIVYNGKPLLPWMIWGSHNFLETPIYVHNVKYN